MKIAILSGKGGTGKTTLSVNLASVVNNSVLIDCDVEEPNAHIFLDHEMQSSEKLEVRFPEIDNNKCSHCRACAEFCKFHAIISGPKVTLPLKELCHDCGGCFAVCPSDAVSFNTRTIGDIFSCTVGTDKTLIYGVLNTGELSGVKIIEKVKSMVDGSDLVIVDSPPGTSCSTVAAVEDTDYAVIVSEPTPFGVSDMKMVVELLRSMNIPFSIVVNKGGVGNNEIYKYCESENIEIIHTIPFDIQLARSYADGRPAYLISDQYRILFEEIWDRIFNRAKGSCKCL